MTGGERIVNAVEDGGHLLLGGQTVIADGEAVVRDGVVAAQEGFIRDEFSGLSEVNECVNAGVEIGGDAAG
jgi:hypothetical protein